MTATTEGGPRLPPIGIQLVEATQRTGIRFKHENGAAGRYHLAETMGSGCAFLDYNGDGRLDLFLVNSSRLPGFSEKGPFLPALYRQRSDGAFEDVTRAAGLAVESYGMGVAVGDYDGDGDPDLYLTALGRGYLYQNDGGVFRDVTRAAGVLGPAFGSSAVWLDYDRDGDLDLFICNYCRWTPAISRACGDSSGRYICGPKYYAGTSSLLYRNDGGRFADVTAAAGVRHTDGKALGVVVWDFNGDGWLDFAVANDTTPNWLYRNNRNGTFTEVGVETGVAYASTGQARAGMGIDLADLDGSGRGVLLIGNNSSEGLGLFRPEAAPPEEGAAHFADVAEEMGVFDASMPFSTFGALYADLDLDGYVDAVAANGHVNEKVARLSNWIGFAQRLMVLQNQPESRTGSRRLVDLGDAAGSGAAKPRVARGLASGDVDGDGDVDLLLNVNDGPAALLLNEGAPRGHWLAVRLRGAGGNREGLGARLVAHFAERRQTAWVRGGGSYCSDSEHIARFGLGTATRVDRLEIIWPRGRTRTLSDVKADQLLVVDEISADRSENR